jgi:ABC-2 type transport system ATP-binding protein
VRNLRNEGTTIVLTTQYLEEADRLADKITVIDHGTIIAEGTAEHLKSCVGGEVIELKAADPAAAKAAEVIAANFDIPAAEISFDPDRGHALVPIPTGTLSVFGAVRMLDAAGLELDDVSLRRSSLDDVFLALTGHLPAGAIEAAFVETAEDITAGTLW